MEQLGQVEQEREQWQAAATAGLMHLSEPIDTLMQRRSSLREALRTWRRFDPDTSRYVVVIGPAGAGKSTFIKQQLSDHGYTGGPQQQELHVEMTGCQLHLQCIVIDNFVCYQAGCKSATSSYA